MNGTPDLLRLKEEQLQLQKITARRSKIAGPLYA
jgi:hypothetical protein